MGRRVVVMGLTRVGDWVVARFMVDQLELLVVVGGIAGLEELGRMTRKLEEEDVDGVVLEGRLYIELEEEGVVR